MTILSREYLKTGNCYISFAHYPADIDVDGFNGFWTTHRHRIFFEFPEMLLDTYCGITCSYSMFDPYLPTEYRSSSEILKIADEMLGWASSILKCPSAVFVEYLDLYDASEKVGKVTEEEMRMDLVETLLYLVGKLTQIATLNHALVLDGI